MPEVRAKIARVPKSSSRPAVVLGACKDLRGNAASQFPEARFRRKRPSVLHICCGSVIARLISALERNLLPIYAQDRLVPKSGQITESVPLAILLLQSADNFIH